MHGRWMRCLLVSLNRPAYMARIHGVRVLVFASQDLGGLLLSTLYQNLIMRSAARFPWGWGLTRLHR